MTFNAHADLALHLPRVYDNGAILALGQVPRYAFADWPLHGPECRYTVIKLGGLDVQKPYTSSKVMLRVAIITDLLTNSGMA